MDFETSLAYDFRAISLKGLLDRVEEYIAALNLPSQAYALRTRPTISQSQLSFMPSPAFAVIGQSCAGKTTFGEHAHGSDYEMVHIEASGVMQTIELPTGSPDDLSPFNRANLLMLNHGFDVVARQIGDIYSQDLNGAFVITGLRTLQEIEFLKVLVPRVQIVLIEASEETRYDRYLSRARPGDELSLGRFRSKDAEHQAFGLLGVAEQIADIRIRNEGSLDDYLRQVSAVLANRTARVRGVTGSISNDGIRRSQLYRVLSALNATKRPMSPSEIECATSNLGTVKRSSVRKVLSDAPALVHRAGEDTAIAYELSDGGESYLALLHIRLR
jgi:hypothetical protein